jgi:ATP-dependent protease ClpP protease subunit
MIIAGQEQYFYYCIDPTADEPILLINKHIGYDIKEGYGIMGDVFMKELFLLDTLKKKRIKVFINSPGGVVNEGYSIYMALLKTVTPVDTYAGGIVASISAVIFQGGRKRVMMDYAQLMYHEAYNPDGSEDKGLNAINESIAIAIASRTGKSEQEVSAVMKRTTWMNAEQALALGFSDETEPTEKMNKKYALGNHTEVKAFHLESNKVLNSIINFKNEIPMEQDYKVELSKVNAKLNLNPEATHESRMLALETVLVKAKMSDDKRNEAEEKMEDLKKAMKKAQDEADDCKSKLAKMEEKIKADDEARAKADEKAKAKEAKDMIAAFVAKGTITNDEKIIAAWETKACADAEGIKALLESMPLNKTAPKKIIEAPGSGKGIVGSIISNRMAELNNKMTTSPVGKE